MKTKNCPFCGKEISDEAIICKFCHRLLIDENGRDIEPDDAVDETAEEEVYEEPETAAETYDEPEEEEEGSDEDKTRVFSPEDVKKAMAQQKADDDAQYDDYYDNESPASEEGYYAEDGEEYYDDKQQDYYGGEPQGAAPLSEDEFFQEFGFKPKKPSRSADIAADEYDPKRTFMITAIITVGILLVIIAAIFVGYKLFGFGNEEKTSSTAPINNKPAASQTVSAADPQTASDGTADASAADDSGYAPAVTDDTISENPEEISNSSLSDPVTYTDSALSNGSAADSSSIADNSAADTTSSDSSLSTDDSSSVSDATDSYDAGFEPAGAYYSWDEAMTIMSTYASNNGIDSYSYYGGTDGVEMLFIDGNGQIYRVDLQSGAVSLY